MKFNSFLGGALTALVVASGTALLLRGCQKEPVDVVTESTQEVQLDTIPKFIEAPVPTDSTVVKYVQVKVPVYDTIRTNLTERIVSDSVSVELPITQKKYQDSTYTAWVSGYRPALDSIRIYQPVTTITNTITKTEVRYKNKRWGVGIQVGMGVTPTKVEPYIGIGVSYNIFSW